MCAHIIPVVKAQRHLHVGGKEVIGNVRDSHTCSQIGRVEPEEPFGFAGGHAHGFYLAAAHSN